MLSDLLGDKLWRRPWFGPGLGVMLYLSGINDELLHVIGTWWLDLGRWVQTVVVVVALALITWLVVDRLRQRQSAYRSAVRAADASRPVLTRPDLTRTDLTRSGTDR